MSLTLHALLKPTRWKPAYACVLADMLIALVYDAVVTHKALLRELHPRRIWFHPKQRYIEHQSNNVHMLETNADSKAAYVMLEKLLVALQQSQLLGARQLQYAILHALGWNSAIHIDPKHVQAALRKYPMQKQQTKQEKHTYRWSNNTLQPYMCVSAPMCNLLPQPHNGRTATTRRATAGAK